MLPESIPNSLHGVFPLQCLSVWDAGEVTGYHWPSLSQYGLDIKSLEYIGAFSRLPAPLVIDMTSSVTRSLPCSSVTSYA